MNILACFLTHNYELSLSEIARIVDRNTTSTYRLIQTLEQMRFLERNPTNKKYFLGKMIERLSEMMEERHNKALTQELIFVAHPCLSAIRDTLNETASLFIYHNYKRLCIDRLESTHSLRQTCNVGDELPLTRGAGGTALLASLPRNLRMAIVRIEGGPDETELARIRHDGYAISYDEMNQGTAGIGVPLFYAEDHLPAVLNLSGPLTRMTQDIVQRGLALLRQAAIEIATKMRERAADFAQK